VRRWCRRKLPRAKWARKPFGTIANRQYRGLAHSSRALANRESDGSSSYSNVSESRKQLMTNGHGLIIKPEYSAWVHLGTTKGSVARLLARKLRRISKEFTATNQKVGSSNLSGRAILQASCPLRGISRPWLTVLCRYGCGVAFKLSRGLSSWTFHVIHSFCSLASCADGADPSGGLIIDSNGNLYSTTGGGGSNGRGTVFKLSHVPGSPWVLDSLYSFCPLFPACADGSEPSGNLVFDSVGNLYGTTPYGGFGYGVAFEIIP
jgi:uncharacterized repeat protein (TIGR03803 family)